MQFDSKFWLKFSLFNISIVALIGLLMRYKIAFEFPYFDQKSLQNSHSHFAFSGWVSQTLMILMIGFLEKQLKKKGMKMISFKRFNSILMTNLICSYGMLASFIIQDYGLVSILFSTASILVSYVFGYQYFKDLKLIDKDSLSVNWFKAAIVFNVLSSFGTFYLAYMMFTKNIIQEEYLASIYYYLHFQYNGWFFFACMGLLFSFLDLQKSENSFYRTSFKLFFVTCIPGYLLSILWWDLPIWINALAVISALVQTFTWFKLLPILIKNKLQDLRNSPVFLRYILLFVTFALSVKISLQLGITLPTVSQLAIGFRPIVIAYLHLVLLAFTTLFLLFYIYTSQLFIINKQIKFGIVFFSIGVLLNEIILAIQGIASFSYTAIPYVNEMLFGITIIMVFGIGIGTFFSVKKS